MWTKLLIGTTSLLQHSTTQTLIVLNSCSSQIAPSQEQVAFLVVADNDPPALESKDQRVLFLIIPVGLLNG